MSTASADRAALFSQLVDVLSRDDSVSRSTMMGFPCLRVNDKFFACADRATGNLIVKLPAGRVNELVKTRIGLPFAPNGRVFTEWVAIPNPDCARWTDLLHEARKFVEQR